MTPEVEGQGPGPGDFVPGPAPSIEVEADESGLRDVIMVIRHGEKPTKSDRGVTVEGIPNKKSLTITGWVRSGALVELFAPASGSVRAGLFRPRALFASNRSGPGGGSDREQETLQFLAWRLGVEVNVEHGVGEESQLMRAVTASVAPVLICWKHDYLAALAECLGEVSPAVPSAWPEERYDVVWVFTKPAAPSSSGYRFSQIPELVMPGDLPTPIL